MTIDGTDVTGAALQEIKSCAGGAGTYEMAKAFATRTRIRSNVDPGGTLDVKTGKGFSVGEAFSDLDLLGVNDTTEAAASSDAATGTVVPTTAPDGSKVFVVRYRVLPLATQGAHTHTITAT